MRTEGNRFILLWAGQTQRTESSFRSQFLGDDKQEDEGAREVCHLRESRKPGQSSLGKRWHRRTRACLQILSGLSEGPWGLQPWPGALGG